MKVALVLFAAHREAAGANRLDLDVPEGTTVGGLYRILEEELPQLAPLRAYTTFAVNREVADPSSPLRAGDEVAFLQPLSGG